MSEKEIINDEMIFQSFSKNYIFDSNREPNKTSQNENIEFTFKKNLFFQKSEESPSKINDMKNSNNKMSPLNDKIMNIYSKNDSNLQESGHFGKSKYDSNKYKNIIEENSSFNKKPLFPINEKISGKYSKPNLNIKKTERAESKLSTNKIKKSEITKNKSKQRMNSLNNNYNNNIKDTYINKRNKNINKKIKTESTYSLKVNNININDNNNNNKRSKKHLKEEINNNNINERKTYNININNDPVLNRMKKMKDNYVYKEIFNNTFNRTSNNNNKNFINSQIIENEIKPIKNNYHQFISINGFSNTNKIRKIPTGRYIDIQPKLKPNFEINNTTKQISRNTRLYKENKENIPININNTIINYCHKQPIYINEIKPINSINYRPSFNPNKMFNSKNKYDKRKNAIEISTENYLKLKSEMYPNIKIDLIMSNKNKNIDKFLYNKLNTINVNVDNKKNIRFAQIKRTNIPKSNISKKKLMVKSFIMKDSFEF